MNIPPIKNGCCGTPCFYEHVNPENYPCWGTITCVDTDLIELEDGGYDEYRYGACDGHCDMYPSYDETKYNKPNDGNKFNFLIIKP